MVENNTQDVLTSKIIEIVSEYTTEDLLAVSLTDTLDNIGIDSLSLVEIIFDIEELFDISIPNESDLESQGHSLLNINDVLVLVRRLIDLKN